MSESVASPRLMALLAALLALAIVAALILGARSLHPKGPIPSHPNPKAFVLNKPIPPSVASNGWIAYSTDGTTPGSAYPISGSDIYLVRAGIGPRLIAGRDGGKIRNVCPAFSPDGKRLTYGVDAAPGRALVVLGMDVDGVITATVRLPVPGSGSIVCPRWSSDGKSVAYLDHGTVVVRGLDGSTFAAAAGDPQVADFGLAVPGLDGARRLGTEPLLSPKGDRIARLSGTCQVIVAKPDGTGAHVISSSLKPNGCYYALPTWSPDGRQVLVLTDLEPGFTVQAIAVDSPFEMVTIVSRVATNGLRSLPGWGDVSWQAVLPSGPIPPSLAANGWIAYSTDGPDPGSTDITTGTDIYLARAGVQPRLIAGRDGGKLRNICPAFSPDGRRLAYGVDSAEARALVVLAVDENGLITDTARMPVAGSGSKVCPRWSSDGKRVAYLDRGTVIVRGLDGSTLAGVAGDPRAEDFGIGRPNDEPLLSPNGDRIASLGNCRLVVAKPDGAPVHVIPLDTDCGYAIPAWSPDGRQVLIIQETGSFTFTLLAIAVDSPFEIVTIVSNVQTNGARSQPHWGDASWQPVLA